MPYYETSEDTNQRLGWVRYAAAGQIVVHQWGTDDGIVVEKYLRTADLDPAVTAEVQAHVAGLEVANEVRYLGNLSTEAALKLQQTLEAKLVQLQR